MAAATKGGIRLVSAAQKLISTMKRSDFKSSLDIALPVLSAEREHIGHLVPVGEWILAESEIIEAMTAWRRRWMRMFLSNFEPTTERTIEYLRNLPIASPDRVLFLIYAARGDLLGHAGLMNVTGNSGAVDNVMRGVSGGHPRLMYFAATCLLDWCFRSLALNAAEVVVMSYNRPMLRLMNQVGFGPVEAIYLFKRTEGDTTFHDFTEKHRSNVDYTCTRLSLTADQFYRANEWLRR